MPEKEIIITAIKDFLKPFVTEVITECLKESFLSLEQKRRKHYYTREEVCERLHIGSTTFYRLARKGKIRVLKLEGRTLVDADELDQAIETRQVFRYQH